MGGILASLQRIFVRGMLLMTPLAITYLILRWLFLLVAGFSSPLVERVLIQLGTPIGDSPLLPYFAPLIAILITVGVVLIIGLVGGNFVGRRILNNLEQVFLKIPLVRWFYGSARQIIDAFRASGGGAFQEVVLLEYPRRGIWCLGFVTNSATGMVPGRTDEECVYVYLPTTPNPTSGYTVVVPRTETSPVDISVDEGLKLIVSGGFISPRLGAARDRN